MQNPARQCVRWSPSLLVILFLFFAITARAQAQDHLLEGVIDFHCHSGPDVIGRSINDFEVVRQAKAAGMRAIVLKNHYTMTADRCSWPCRRLGAYRFTAESH